MYVVTVFYVGYLYFVVKVSYSLGVVMKVTGFFSFGLVWSPADIFLVNFH